MQQYRINYRLLLGLFVGTIIAAVLLVLLWHWQVNRKANWYLDTADEALKEDDSLKAFQYMQYFVKLRRDDDEARVKLATIAFDVLEAEGVPRDERALAFGYISDTVRRTSDEETRRKLADLYFNWGEAQQAEVHYKELLKTSDDPELKSRYVRTLFLANDYLNATKMACELIGLDLETETFDDEKAEAADQPEVYSALAAVLLDRENKEELAKKVIDKMIEKNPDSAVAHYHSSIYLYQEGDKDAAKEELEKAYQLDPDNSQILIRKIQLALEKEDPNQAIKLAEGGIEKSPKNLGFYVYGSKAYRQAKQQEEAVAILDRGIREFGEQRSVGLFQEKFDVLLAADDVDGSEEVIERLEKLKEPQLQPLIDFEKARISYSQRKWVTAAKQLRRVRPLLVSDRNMQIRAGFMLAEAYEKLGMDDKAIEYYRLLARDETIPDSYPFKQVSSSRLAKLEGKMGISTGSVPMDVGSVIARELEKNESDQDWDSIFEMIDKLAESRDLSEAQVLLIQADIYRKRGMIEEAKDKVRAAAKLDPDEEAVMLTAAQVFIADLPDGPAKAKSLLKKIEAKSGVTLQTRLLLLEAIVRSQSEEMNSELLDIAQNIEPLSDEDKSRLLYGLGTFFSKIGEFEQAESLIVQAAELAPGDLPMRNMLFEIAFKRRDDESMDRAQQMILDVVGSKEDGSYVLSEVRRRLIGYRGDSAGRQRLEEAREMLDNVLELRPQWHELHIVYAQLLLVLGEDMEQVLEHFDDALKYGPPNSLALVQQITILAESGLMNQARERMELLPERNRTALLGPTEADILMAAGDIEAAYESAKESAERRQNDAKIQAWFGNIAEQANELDEAAEAYQKAAKLNPKNELFWRRLLAAHAKREDATGVIDVMRAAQLSLEPELVPQFQATYFELQNQWSNAESILKSLYQDDYETNPEHARQLAAFYFRWGSKVAEKVPLAFPYLNSILKAGQDGSLKPNSPLLLYAAERAAAYLYSTNSYQNSRKGLRIIRQCSGDDSIPQPLMPLYLKILTQREDPKSILEAIGLLAQLYEQGRLDKENQLLLAKLYQRTSQWEKGKDLMIDALSKFGTDEDVWTTYITLLIKQGEYTTASNRINRFADISKNPGTIASLRASLAHERGDDREVAKALGTLLPPGGLAGALSENDLKMVKAVAAMAVQYGQYEDAEKLLRIYVRRKNPDGVFDLVSLLATHGDMKEALAIMDGLFPSNPLDIARLSVQVFRDRGRELDETQSKHLWSFITRVVDERPDDPDRIMMRGEAYEAREMYDQAIADYGRAIELGLNPIRKSIALNNLAYLLANTGQRLDETTEMTQAAIDVLGPLADILDTRAVIRMARKEYDLAVEDMVLSLAVDPTAPKYYHLARAHAMAGNSKEALEAWNKAREMNIEKEDLPLMEQSNYDETERLIQKLQSQ